MTSGPQMRPRVLPHEARCRFSNWRRERPEEVAPETLGHEHPEPAACTAASKVNHCGALGRVGSASRTGGQPATETLGRLVRRGRAIANRSQSASIPVCRTTQRILVIGDQRLARDNTAAAHQSARITSRLRRRRSLAVTGTSLRRLGCDRRRTRCRDGTGWLAWSDSNCGICEPEIRLSCRENWPDLGEGIVQRRFQCELRVREPTAAAGRLADRVHRRPNCITFVDFISAREGTRTAERKKIIEGRRQFPLELRFEQSNALWPTDTEPPGSLLSPASAAGPPRGFGGGGALLRRYLERSFEMSQSKPARSVRRRSARKARSR